MNDDTWADCATEAEDLVGLDPDLPLALVRLRPGGLYLPDELIEDLEECAITWELIK